MPYASSTPPSNHARFVGGTQANYESDFGDHSDPEEIPRLLPMQVYMTVPTGPAAGPAAGAAAGTAPGPAVGIAALTATATAASPSTPPGQHTYPFTVTLQNGRTQLHITQAMGEKAVKSIADGAPAEDATPKDLQCY